MYRASQRKVKHDLNKKNFGSFFCHIFKLCARVCGYASTHVTCYSSSMEIKGPLAGVSSLLHVCSGQNNSGSQGGRNGLYPESSSLPRLLLTTSNLQFVESLEAFM